MENLEILTNSVEMEADKLQATLFLSMFGTYLPSATLTLEHIKEAKLRIGRNSRDDSCGCVYCRLQKFYTRLNIEYTRSKRNQRSINGTRCLTIRNTQEILIELETIKNRKKDLEFDVTGDVPSYKF